MVQFFLSKISDTLKYVFRRFNDYFNFLKFEIFKSEVINKAFKVEQFEI